MLKQIRENARVPLYLLIVAFIGLYAVSGHDTVPPAGKIFGKKVPISDFQKAYNGVKTQLTIRYGKLPNDSKIEPVLEDEAWNRLIMLYEAKKERIKVTDKDIVDYVKGVTAFNDKSGRFSKRQYEEILRYGFGLTPAEFEAQVRDNLTIDKLIEKHSDDVKLTDAEILNEYRFLNEKAKADYILFKTSDFLTQAVVTEDEVKAYFEKNKAAFKIPTQVNAEYIAKPFPDDKEETKQKVRKEIKDISYEFAADTDLAAAAKKFSLEVKETGFFNRETNIPGIGYDLKFADTALSLAVGQVSSPLETKTGVYIIKIKEKKPERQATFVEVKDDAEKNLKAEKADAIAKVKAQEALKSLKAGSSLPFKKTEAFARGQYIEGLGVSPEFAEAAFSVKQGELFGDTVKIHDGYAIVRQDSITPIDEKKFQEEKDKLKKSLLEQKKYFASITWFNELRKKANPQPALNKARAARQ